MTVEKLLQSLDPCPLCPGLLQSCLQVGLRRRAAAGSKLAQYVCWAQIEQIRQVVDAHFFRAVGALAGLRPKGDFPRSNCPGVSQHPAGPGWVRQEQQRFLQLRTEPHLHVQAATHPICA